jgi:hypothetical protein
MQLIAADALLESLCMFMFLEVGYAHNVSCKSIMQQVQQLLPLLTLCANSTKHIEMIIHQISGELADSACSTEAVQAHMQHVCHGLQVMSATAATSEDVREAVCKIIQSSTKLSDGNMAEVQRLCNKLHVSIAQDLKDISGALHDMEASIRTSSIRILGLQEQACACGGSQDGHAQIGCMHCVDWVCIVSPTLRTNALILLLQAQSFVRVSCIGRHGLCHDPITPND